jgi:hypothetical protein
VKLFKCQVCDQLLYFENRLCLKCEHHLGYLPEDERMHAVEPEGEGWRALGAPDRLYRFCANAGTQACNWLVAIDSPEQFCLACRHNRTIPDVSQPENMEAWRKLELAKHRLFYSLVKLRLPLANRNDDPQAGLAFHFLADPPDGGKVATGHENGLITLALQEADDGERETRRTEMREPYRTLLGHFRHEIGHYYWDKLVRDKMRLEECRSLFGDEREDYAAALQRHYTSGPPANWQDNYISAYATSHPWEDFVETWAHYLHIVDTLETAAAFGVNVRPALDVTGELAARVDFDPYRADSIEKLIDSWLPITFAVNSINRSMGQLDVYPFILSAQVIKKLGFVHDLIHSVRKQGNQLPHEQRTETVPFKEDASF